MMAASLLETSRVVHRVSTSYTFKIFAILFPRFARRHVIDFTQMVIYVSHTCRKPR